jgi:hypothetical protein
MQISSPTFIVERAGNCAWAHKNWRVREEFARSIASAINLFAATELLFQRMLLPSVSLQVSLRISRMSIQLFLFFLILNIPHVTSAFESFSHISVC